MVIKKVDNPFDEPLMRQRTYVDGQLVKTSSIQPASTIRRWMDNVQREWSKHLDDAHIDPEAMRGTNQGKEVIRVSIDQLNVITTEDKSLRFLNVEVKK